MSAGAHFSQHGMATYSTMTRPNMTWAMPHTHTPQYMLCKMGQRTLQTTHKKKKGMEHYTPHKQGMRRYTTQKWTMGIFYATHETNNGTLNTQQNEESLRTSLILIKFTVTPRRFRERYIISPTALCPQPFPYSGVVSSLYTQDPSHLEPAYSLTTQMAVAPASQ